MEEDEMIRYKPCDSRELTRITQGLVLRMPLEYVPALKDFLARMDSTEIIYQCTKAGRIRIVDE